MYTHVTIKHAQDYIVHIYSRGQNKVYVSFAFRPVKRLCNDRLKKRSRPLLHVHENYGKTIQSSPLYTRLPEPYIQGAGTLYTRCRNLIYMYMYKVAGTLYTRLPEHYIHVQGCQNLIYMYKVAGTLYIRLPEPYTQGCRNLKYKVAGTLQRCRNLTRLPEPYIQGCQNIIYKVAGT